ncbi:hypothetical protein ACWDTP_33215 [Mycobacterium sp. NPDC003449]
MFAELCANRNHFCVNVIDASPGGYPLLAIRYRVRRAREFTCRGRVDVAMITDDAASVAAGPPPGTRRRAGQGGISANSKNLTKLCANGALTYNSSITT